MVQYPGMITAYAMPFNNTTTCATTSAWVTTNGLNLYSPYDSGAVQVANYGGFGMPTAVVLGGTDHRVMFATQSYSSGDTLIMRDSILALFGAAPLGINNDDLPAGLSSLYIYPNPTSNNTTIALDITETADAHIEILDMTGNQVGIISNAKNQKGIVLVHYNTEALASGTYILRININDKTTFRKLNVSH
ncbi:MAG: T9SS type A sorting domain-containing protein [Bacteroidetes bacterium]|nr:T9SS type A sorting domain-containing protein [Bacteroidota bacterium]